MFKKVVCLLLIFLFAGNAFAVEVETIGPAGGQAPASGARMVREQLLQMQRQLQEIQLQLQSRRQPGGPPSQAPQLEQPQAGQTGFLPFGAIGNYAAMPSPGAIGPAMLPGQIMQPGQNGGIENAPAIANATASPAGPPEKLSEVEKFFDREASGNSPALRQFGYGLFNQGVTTFAPGNEIPVTPGYVIGPGDEIRIDIWGKINGSWALTVDKDGNLNIPEIGPVGVAGLTFSELKKVLRQKLSEYYTGFEMNVSMGSLKSMRIYVVGNARMPGAYTVSSLSTLVGALFECGGPSKNGSMRDIQLKRDGKTITTVDLYDFLLKGDNSNDVRLLPGDVIFIPPIGPVAGVEGNVKRPAIYELKGGTKISDLLSMAGGITPDGYLKDVQLERVHGHEIKTMIDTDFKDLNPKTDIPLRDGDFLKVLSINNKLDNAVTLEGNVVRPGQYQWFKGMRVSDLIKNSEKDLRKDTDFDIAVVERYIPPDYHNEFFSFNLGKALFDKGGPEDKLLEPYDVVHIYSKWDFKTRPAVRIAGAVGRPGEYEFTPGMKVSDLLGMAGGVKRYAFMNKVELTRVNITSKGPDTVRIYLDLKKSLAGDPADNIALQRDDYLFVRSVPDWRLYRTVTIKGEVRFPGTYAVRKDERLSSLLERAGGFTKDAYLEGAVFTRESVQAMQQSSMDEMVRKLQSRLYAEQSVQMSGAITQEDVSAKQSQLVEQREFIDSLKHLKATGRMVIALSDLKSFKGSVYDIGLENGDVLDIPAKNSVVNVVGSVMSGTTSLVYSGGLGARDYIKMAGGYSENADKDHVYVLKADGSARRLSGDTIKWDASKHRWETGSAVIISPGDTIVVPEQLQQVSWLRGIRDITQIMMQIAVTAGVVIKIL
ncbi:MAG: SLBB domain-containing protein [Nitrospiraceae bacterium]|nr:SLBB domain-containing protein [Nitrospiraceae bacterium]